MDSNGLSRIDQLQEAMTTQEREMQREADAKFNEGMDYANDEAANVEDYKASLEKAKENGLDADRADKMLENYESVEEDLSPNRAEAARSAMQEDLDARNEMADKGENPQYNQAYQENEAIYRTGLNEEFKDTSRLKEAIETDGASGKLNNIDVDKLMQEVGGKAETVMKNHESVIDSNKAATQDFARGALDNYAGIDINSLKSGIEEFKNTDFKGADGKLDWDKLNDSFGKLGVKMGDSVDMQKMGRLMDTVAGTRPLFAESGIFETLGKYFEKKQEAFKGIYEKTQALQDKFAESVDESRYQAGKDVSASKQTPEVGAKGQTIESPEKIAKDVVASAEKVAKLTGKAEFNVGDDKFEITKNKKTGALEYSQNGKKQTKEQMERVVKQSAEKAAKAAEKGVQAASTAVPPLKIAMKVFEILKKIAEELKKQANKVKEQQQQAIR